LDKSPSLSPKFESHMINMAPSPCPPILIHMIKMVQNRTHRIEERSKRNKDTERGLTVAGLEGDTHWEKTVNLVNFNFTR